MSGDTVRAAAFAVALLFVFAATAIAPIAFGWVELDGANRAGSTYLLITAAITAAWVFWARATKPDEWIAAYLPRFIIGLLLVSVGNISAAVLFAGPTFGVVAVYFVEIPILAFFFTHRRWAIALTAFAMFGYVFALTLADDPPAPVEQFIVLLSSAVATGVLLGTLAARFDEARRALADLTKNLELRVADQVDELERTGRLKRFLSPQVADVVTARDTEELLAPHRSDIAVLFVDLRGFSRYTNHVSAENVVRVLTEYYELVGEVLQNHGATVGGLDGDGIFAYLGDPVPRADAACAAVVMARDVATVLDGKVDRWRADEHELGYGIGLSYGSATLGVIGFEGLYDYTAVGAVVNLAARLCADAQHGEIVVDDALRKAAELDDARVARRADVDLKGFGTVPTYAVSH